MNLCSVEKSDGTMERGHEQRRNLQAVMVQQPPHTRAQMHGHGWQQACRAVSGQSWGATGPAEVAGRAPGPRLTMQQLQQQQQCQQPQEREEALDVR